MTTDDETDNAVKSLREFAYQVSHDLNAPLRAVASFSKILLDEHGGQLNEEGKEYLTLVAGEAARAQAMLNGLLEYSRLNTMAKTTSTRIDTHRVYKDCLLVLNDDIKRTLTKCIAGALPVIQADAEQFMQLLLYGFENAIKFARPGVPPIIHFQGTQEDEHWHFTITDNGIGIEQAYREKVFTLFRQLHPAGVYPGIGMGLTLAQKIVERHAGRIWIEDSGEPHGIALHFTLPK